MLLFIHPIIHFMIVVVPHRVLDDVVIAWAKGAVVAGHVGQSNSACLALLAKCFFASYILFVMQSMCVSVDPETRDAIGQTAVMW